MFKSAVDEAARSVKANCEPKKERTERCQSILLKETKKNSTPRKDSGDSVTDAAVKANALALICSSYVDSNKDENKDYFQNRSEIKLGMSEINEPVDIKSVPPEVETKPTKVKSKSPKVKSELIKVQSEHLEVKSEPIAIQLEPMDIKSESPEIIKSKIKSKSSKVKSDPIVVKSEPMDVKPKSVLLDSPSVPCPEVSVDKSNSSITDLNCDKSKTIKTKSSVTECKGQSVSDLGKVVSDCDFSFALPLKSENDDLNRGSHYFDTPHTNSESAEMVSVRKNATSTDSIDIKKKSSPIIKKEIKVIPDSTNIISVNDFKFALPLKSDNEDLNLDKHFDSPINTINAFSKHCEKTTDTKYDFQLPLSSKDKQNSDASTSFLKSDLGREDELCSAQTLESSQKDTDYVKYFKEKHRKDGNRIRSKSSHVSGSVDSSAHSLKGCRETQSAPSLCEQGKTHHSSTDSGYISLSNDSPLSSRSKRDRNIKDDSNAYRSKATTPGTPVFSPVPAPEPLKKSKSNRDNAESPSLKRTFSFTFDDSSEISTNQLESKNPSIFRKSFGSSENVAHKFRHRRSGSDFNSPVSNLSSKFTSCNNIHTPVRSYSKCATDQTPESPQESPRFQKKRMRTNLSYYNAHSLQNFESEVGFIDSHCHLDFLFQRQDFNGTYADYQEKHKDTFPKSYKGCVAIFCNPFTFAKNPVWKKLLEEDNVWAAFGCHPHNAKDYDMEIDEALIKALEHPKVRALGEIGLDYSNRNNCAKDTQHRVFKRQLQLALKKKLPLVIHCREAHTDCLSIMKEEVPANYRIHLHCFTDTWSVATQWLEAFPNLRIGLTNLVTYPSAESVHEVARRIPLDRLLLETDTPYFVPKTLGRDARWSHPGMAIHVAAQVATLKENISLETVLKATMSNTRKLYGIE